MHPKVFFVFMITYLTVKDTIEASTLNHIFTTYDDNIRRTHAEDGAVRNKEGLLDITSDPPTQSRFIQQNIQKITCNEFSFENKNYTTPNCTIFDPSKLATPIEHRLKHTPIVDGVYQVHPSDTKHVQYIFWHDNVPLELSCDVVSSGSTRTPSLVCTKSREPLKLDGKSLIRIPYRNKESPSFPFPGNSAYAIHFKIHYEKGPFTKMTYTLEGHEVAHCRSLDTLLIKKIDAIIRERGYDEQYESFILICKTIVLGICGILLLISFIKPIWMDKILNGLTGQIVDRPHVTSIQVFKRMKVLTIDPLLQFLEDVVEALHRLLTRDMHGGGTWISHELMEILPSDLRPIFNDYVTHTIATMQAIHESSDVDMVPYLHAVRQLTISAMNMDAHSRFTLSRNFEKKFGSLGQKSTMI
jgi:hypothetical protein